jgi:3-isopropylmalate/(R)-2-methylmalate dehydratase small subunit
MKAFTQVTARVAPLDRPNVDTDAIIPKQYLKSIKRTGFGQYLFDDWRYLDQGDLEIPVASRRVNPDFVLNKPEFRGAEILLSRENFGCGSSREHAVWALEDYGFRAVIAPSYADIFFNNCFKNGILPVVLPKEELLALMDYAQHSPGQKLTVNLEKQTVSGDEVGPFAFNVEAFRKHCLLNGLDDIGLSLQHAGEIAAYEAKQRELTPWLAA